MSGDHEQMEFLRGEVAVCGFLGTLLYGGPGRAYLEVALEHQMFAQPPFRVAHSDLEVGLRRLAAWSDEYRSGLTQPEYDAIEADHARLFLGPGRLYAAPWASVYGDGDRDRVLFTRNSIAVGEWYARFGLRRASTYNEPDDHIGLQLDFLAKLAAATLAASAARDHTGVEELLEARREFLLHHMLGWVPLWSLDVERFAQTDFYRAIALLVRGLTTQLDEWYDIRAASMLSRGHDAGQLIERARRSTHDSGGVG